VNSGEEEREEEEEERGEEEEEEMGRGFPPSISKNEFVKSVTRPDNERLNVTSLIFSKASFGSRKRIALNKSQ